jgi:hypothetical protein
MCTDAIGCWGNETYGLARQASCSRTELFPGHHRDRMGSHFLGGVNLRASTQTDEPAPSPRNSRGVQRGSIRWRTRLAARLLQMCWGVASCANCTVRCAGLDQSPMRRMRNSRRAMRPWRQRRLDRRRVADQPSCEWGVAGRREGAGAADRQDGARERFRSAEGSG